MLVLNICPKSPKSHYNISKRHNFEKLIQYVQIYLNYLNVLKMDEINILNLKKLKPLQFIIMQK
jgi:hypothetical protein